MTQTKAKKSEILQQEFTMQRHRHPCLFIAEMRVSGEPSQLVLITNYATAGFAIQALSPPKMGTRVVIRIANLRSYTGTVRWSANRRFGFRTVEPIDVLELSLTKSGPRFSDYAVPHPPALEGLFLRAAFRQHALD